MLSLIICLRGNPASDCAFCSHSNSQLYDAGWWLCAQSNALIVAEKEKRERDSNVDGSGCLEFSREIQLTQIKYMSIDWKWL